MKIWELQKDKEYICNGVKYLYDTDGCLHIKQPLKRNGCMAWNMWNPSWYKVKTMEFEEVKKESECNHRDKNGNLTIEYDDIYEMRSAFMYCKQCKKEGSREELTTHIYD